MNKRGNELAVESHDSRFLRPFEAGNFSHGKWRVTQKGLHFRAIQQGQHQAKRAFLLLKQIIDTSALQLNPVQIFDEV